MRNDIKMKPTEGDLSERINELSNKATQLLTFLSFAIVSAVLLETAQSPVLAPYQRGAIKWAMRFWVMALFPILINVFPVKDLNGVTRVGITAPVGENLDSWDYLFFDHLWRG